MSKISGNDLAIYITVGSFIVGILLFLTLFIIQAFISLGALGGFMGIAIVMILLGYISMQLVD